jgi:hypothetical protein
VHRMNLNFTFTRGAHVARRALPSWPVLKARCESRTLWRAMCRPIAIVMALQLGCMRAIPRRSLVGSLPLAPRSQHRRRHPRLAAGAAPKGQTEQVFLSDIIAFEVRAKCANSGVMCRYRSISAHHLPTLGLVCCLRSGTRAFSS